MIPWELRHRNPMIDVRMVATRQFGASFLVMLGAGAILLATTQYLPQLVQQNFGYTATWAGLVLTPGGIATVFMMPLVGRLTGTVQPRYLIATGAAICATWASGSSPPRAFISALDCRWCFCRSSPPPTTALRPARPTWPRL
jgi:predicted MFS family arabinose efflux permease